MPIATAAEKSMPRVRCEPTAQAAERSRVTRVAITALGPADSPRLRGEDLKHVHLLAQSGAALPPILVHRPTMRVIDGMHRLRAARLRGESDIQVTYYDGDDLGAFIEAVRANITHGLPLTLADRRAAALRILTANPELSDRSVAGLTGLSPKTVGAARRNAGAQLLGPAYRLGQDGRWRPSRTIAPPHPAAPCPGDRPGPRAPAPARTTATRTTASSAAATARKRPSTAKDAHSIIQHLAQDPALRLSERGRALVRRLTTLSPRPSEWSELIAAVPPHWAERLAQLAIANAREWDHLAIKLQRSTPRTPQPPA
jgi:hypothetical protein